MDSSASYLSSPQYQCDFVVSTTQASINSDLWEYLDESTQPIEYLCFLVSETSDDPSEEITLDELVKRTGVNPFDIPEGTPYDDKQITALTEAGFVVGIRMQIGIPPGFMPKDLPPIVTFGNTADKVTFNLYCSDITVIQNSPPSGFHKKEGHWNVYRQPERTDSSTKPWFIQTSVDLKVGDLDRELNTSPYLNSNPEIKARLKDALDNISGTALSLQQLFFDLDNAILESATAFQGIPPGSGAEFILPKAFLNIYGKRAKEEGLPLVSVTAVPQEPDPSSLQMTSFERLVSLLKDSNGDPIMNPTRIQESATTLDHVCMIGGHKLPSISRFGWNWVQPDEINDKSGVISINRNTLVNYMRDYLLRQVTAFCYKSAIWSDGHFELTPGGSPETVNTFMTGSHVIHMVWYDGATGYMNVISDYVSGFLVGYLEPNYTCDVYFAGREIRVEQRLWIYLKAALDYDTLDDDRYNVKLNPVDYSLTEKYEISVDQNGQLQLTNTDNHPEDHSEKLPDVNGDFLRSLVEVGIQGIVAQIKCDLSGQLEQLQMNPLRQFVFPGCKVFTYKNPSFSQHQDLVCDITYLDPIGTESTQRFLCQDLVQRNPAADTLASHQKQNASGGRLSASTELMQNYVHGEIVSPTGKFEALQSSDGHALLFAIDSSGVFHVFEEQSGSSHTGWQMHDLSTVAIEAKFPGRGSDAVVRTFDVGQSAINGTIGLMMAVNMDGDDHLFISLGNSNIETSWTGGLTWTIIPFDPVNEEPQKIVIAGTLFAETLFNKQYLVVDIQRPSGGSVDPHIARYHIDPSKETGSYWVKHDVTVDIAAGNYQSCVGQVSKGHVDGIYTAGTTGGQPQLVYEPIVNYYGDGPPAPRRLHLPGGRVPSSIATSRNTDLTTDLYAVSGSTLYRFPADKQRGDKDEPMVLVTNDLLSGTDTLHAMTHGGVTTLWGRNSNYQVYYLACPAGQVAQADAWSAAVPIFSGVEHISPYLNRTDGGNTIFAAGNGRLRKLMQGSAEAGRKWRAQEITLAIPPEQASHNFMSYTTSIHVTRSDTDSPAPNAPVNLSANSRTPVHINGLYYVLSTTPIQVSTDAMGSITVVEASEGINGTVLTISLDDENRVTINPMDQNFAKLTALNSSDKVRGAKVPSPTVPGGIVGSPAFTPLVAPSTGDEDVDRVAEHLNLMKESYTKAKDPQKTSAVQAFVRRNHGIVPSALFRAGKIPVSKSGFFDAIAAAAGDLFQWLKSAVDDVVHTVEHVAQIIYDDVSDSLHFLATIGGQVFRAVLDTVDAVVGAMEWVFNAVKTGIEDIIQFVEFLFEWDDIRRTKDVMHNVAKLWLQDQVDNIPRAQQAIDGVIAEAEKNINGWAHIHNTDWSPALGDVATMPASSSGSDPIKGHTSGSKLLADKYRDHATQLQILGDSPSENVVGDLLNDLVTAVSNEGPVLGAILTQLQDLVSQFASLSVEDILKRVAAILANGILSSVQVVVDMILKVLCELAQSALNVLDTKIHIPVISDILNAIGVSDISFLDLFTWIGAVAVTLVYKVTEDRPPFPGNDGCVKAIISAGSWDELAGLFGQQGTATMSQSARKGIFESCHLFAGILGVVGNNVLALEAEDQTGSSIIGIPAVVIGFLCAAVSGASDFLVPLDPIESLPFQKLSMITTSAVIGCKAVFSGLGQWGFKKLKIGRMVFEDARGIGAMLNSVLVIHGSVVTMWHFYELSEKPTSNTRTTAILGEVSNLSSYVSRLAYGLAVNDEEQESRVIAILAMGLANYAVGGLQLAQAEVGKAVLS